MQFGLLSVTTVRVKTPVLRPDYSALSAYFSPLMSALARLLQAPARFERQGRGTSAVLLPATVCYVMAQDSSDSYAGGCRETVDHASSSYEHGTSLLTHEGVRPGLISERLSRPLCPLCVFISNLSIPSYKLVRAAFY